MMARTPSRVVDARLDAMFAAQRELQRRILNGFLPHKLSDEAKMAYIREQSLALTDEVHEALAETGWKSWASSNHINRDAYVSELAADALRFFINLLLVADVSPDELFQVFMGKANTVMDRATNGYDGVTGKCPRCHRDLGDKGVGCYQGEDAGGDHVFWCDTVKDYITATSSPVVP